MKGEVNMKENKLRQELETGSIVWLDFDKANKSQVKVISQTSGKLYTTVQGGESKWEVMSYRLTKI